MWLDNLCDLLAVSGHCLSNIFFHELNVCIYACIILHICQWCPFFERCNSDTEHPVSNHLPWIQPRWCSHQQSDWLCHGIRSFDGCRAVSGRLQNPRRKHVQKWTPDQRGWNQVNPFEKFCAPQCEWCYTSSRDQPYESQLRIPLWFGLVWFHQFWHWQHLWTIGHSRCQSQAAVQFWHESGDGSNRIRSNYGNFMYFCNLLHWFTSSLWFILAWNATIIWGG